MNELAEPFPISVQAVSKHLKVLERAGLITRGRTAQLRPSRLQGAPLKDAADWLEEYRRFWEGGFDRLEQRLRATEKGPTWLNRGVTTVEDGISIIRIFDAPRARCGGSGPSRSASPTGSAAPIRGAALHRRDGRPPGRRVAADDVRRPRPARDPLEGEYREVVEPERLVFTVTDEPDGSAYELVTVVLADLGDDRTEMRFEQRGGGLPPSSTGARRRVVGFFDRIDERLAEA